jgi:hypothetical protein
MKKIMIALVAMTIGVAAQAAQVNWQVGGKALYNKADTALTAGQTVYLVLASKQADVAAMLDAGTALTATGANGILGVATTGNNGVITAQTVGSSILAAAGINAGDQIYANILVVDTTSAAGETWYKFSAQNYAAAYDETATPVVATTVKFSAAQFGSAAANHGTAWTKAVPEPTSGLLMLVGLGALALRRKRA